MRGTVAGSERNLWIESLLRPTVIAVMVGCVVWSVTQLLLEFVPSWNPTYIVVGCILVALEAFYSHRLLKTQRMLGANVLRFRTVELLAIFLLFKLGRYTNTSASQIMTEIRAWSQNPLGFFDLETLVAFVIALFCWMMVTETARDFDNIGERLEYRASSVSPVERITTRFFVGGTVLLISAGLARLGGISDLLELQRPAAGGVVLNALLYFLLGMSILGQTHFVRLQKGWQKQQMDISDKLASRWVRYSLAFVALAALVAFALPTGFSFGPLSLMADVLGMIGKVLYFIFLFLLALISFPFSLLFWLLSLLLTGSSETGVPKPAFPVLENRPRAEASDAAGWLEVARAVIFWVILLAGLYFVIRSYLRDRPELRETLASLRPMRALRRGWMALMRSLKQWFTRLRRTVGERMPRRIPRGSSRDAASRPSSFRFIRLGALSPRERVLYYYLSIVRRASQQGFPRQSYQTPHEYSTTLKPNLPQVQEEIETLTQAFVEARYSQHKVEPDQDRQIRSKWERLKAALQALKRRGPSE